MALKLKNLLMIACVTASFSACENSNIIGCPYVPVWTEADQLELLAERHEWEGKFPLSNRALNEYQDMRIESKPCAIMQPASDKPHMIQNIPMPRDGQQY